THKPVVYDLDDLLLDLPLIHPDRQSAFYASSLLPILHALMVADHVIVSTKKLRESLLQYNKNIQVLPNFFADSIWSLRSPIRRSNGGRLTVGYMGGDSHKPDLELIAPVLLHLSKKYQEQIQFHFYGARPPEILTELPQVRWTPVKTYTYDEFAADFQSVDADFFIAPLVDNLFNRCKSAIKFFEYSALGAPGVYSRLDPFTEVITHEEEGLLASSLEDWNEQLTRLIENGEMRYQLALHAQETIRAKWLMSHNAYRWEEAYRKIIENSSFHEGRKTVPFQVIESISQQLFEYNLKTHENQQLTQEKLISRELEMDRVLAEKVAMQQELAKVQESSRAGEQKISTLSQQLVEREQTNKTLAVKYEAAQNELNEIYISKAWRLAKFVREVRVKLLPPGSKSFLFARALYRIGKRLTHKSTENIKKNNPLISVVIPIYDRTNLLIESIDSILSQTYENFELILVCDGSPKETLEIVKSYERSSSKVRAFYFKNNSGNAVRGRNKGIKEAKGEYLAFQDSDDVAEPDRLQNSFDAIQEFNVDVVYGGWRALVDGSRDIGLQDGQEIFSPDCDLELLKQICVPCQSTVMARVETLRNVGGINPIMKYREDHELWLRIAYNGYKFKSINKILTNLRLHKGNLEISLKESDDYWEQQTLNEYKKKIVMKPKIGYVIPGTGIGGGIAVVCEHTNRLIKRGYDVTIISEDNHDNIPWFPGLIGEVTPLDKISSNYDVLVATGWSTAYIVDQLPAKRKFYFVQSDESRFFEPGDPNASLALKTYTLNLHLLTMAKWLQRWLKEKFGRDSIYATNGINEEIIYPVEPIEKKKDKVRVLLEGPINLPYKGMEDAFKAVNGLDCEVWCVSSAGEPKPEWKCDRFFYQVPLEKMKEIYSSCDILLKMSRVESFSLPPLEMMACGGTAVLGDVTGIDEYAIHNYNALIVAQGDVKGAHEALKFLIENKDFRMQLISNGKKTAEQRRWDPTIDILEKVYCDNQDPSS
ncbi:MAG TPA: glycosyltransferase, partial [Ignavibacteriaceae bacterium]|nr:glycosyltransferase [Ignavibacteriaceae bacterium]